LGFLWFSFCSKKGSREQEKGKEEINVIHHYREKATFVSRLKVALCCCDLALSDPNKNTDTHVNIEVH